MAFSHHLHRFFSICSPVRIDPDLLQRGNSAQAQILIIVDHENPPRRKHHVGLLCIRLLQIERDMEFTALARRTLQVDRSLHRLHDGFRDRHAKAGSLDLVDLRFLFPGKCIKNLFLELFCHADAVVLHAEMAPHIIFSHRRLLLRQKDLDHTALRRKFQRVGQQVDQHLVQTHTVTVHLLGDDVLYEDIKMLLP